MQASQLHTVSVEVAVVVSCVVRSGPPGSMGNVGGALVSLSPAAASCPRLPLATGMCRRKSWLCGNKTENGI